MNELRPLLRYARTKVAPPPAPPCELCGAPLAAEHRHVVDLDSRAMQCSCRSCSVLFDQEGGRYRRVPDQVLLARSIPLQRWTPLGVPVRLAFVFYNSRLGRHFASYPSPAGTIESEIDSERFRELAEADPALQSLMPDVQALLAWAPRGSLELQCFVAPIDACYELSGICRTRWTGFDGGDDLRSELSAFFTRLRERAS